MLYLGDPFLQKNTYQAESFNKVLTRNWDVQWGSECQKTQIQIYAIVQ